MTPDEVIDSVCQWYDMTRDELIADFKRDWRKDRFIMQRWITAHVMEEQCRLSRCEISKILNRNTATITYALAKVQYFIGNDPAIDDGIRNVIALARAKQAARLITMLHENTLRAKLTVDETVKLLAAKVQV